MNRLRELLEKKNKFIKEPVNDVILEVLDKIAESKAFDFQIPRYFLDYCFDLKLINVIEGKVYLSKRGEKIKALYDELQKDFYRLYEKALDYKKAIREASKIRAAYLDSGILQVELSFSYYRLFYYLKATYSEVHLFNEQFERGKTFKGIPIKFDDFKEEKRIRRELLLVKLNKEVF